MAAPRADRDLTLTQRRVAQTQWDLALTAARLFARQGYAATAVEEIAEQGGVGLRTFYRYFPTKAHAIVPLLTRGAEDWQIDLAEAAGSGGTAHARRRGRGALLRPICEWSRGRVGGRARSASRRG